MATPIATDSPNFRRAVTLAAIVGFLAVYVAVIYGDLLGERAAEWWTNMAWTIASLATALRCFATAHAERSSAQRRAWWLFGLGALAWFAGMAWWDYRYLIQEAEFVYPYYYDTLFMTFPIFMVAGTFFYRAQSLSKPLSVIQLANLSILALTVTIGCVIVLYEPIQASDQSSLFVGFAIFHAVLHIVAMLFAIYCYAFYVWKASRPMFLLLLASLALHSLADVLYTFELLGESFGAFNYLNVYWLCAFALHYMAAFEQRELNRSGALVEAEDESRSADGNVEALTPAACILALYVLAFIYQDRLSSEVFDATAAAGVLFAGALGIRAWWRTRYQNTLHGRLHAANQELEGRVRERTMDLEAAHERLLRQERLAALGQLTATVSHELRNPLGVLRNSITMIDKLTGQGDERLCRSLARAHRNIDRCDGIIEELLDFSRTRVLKPERVDLSRWLETLLDEYALPPGLHLRRDIDPNLTGDLDCQRLHRLMVNLLDNACESLLQEGSRGATVTVACRADDAEFELVVSDDGPGMSADTAAKIFEPLFSTKGFGVGLGMTIVKQIVDLHAGRVSVTSREGSGTRVVVRLPRG